MQARKNIKNKYKKIENEVMKKISSGEVVMKPKWYFVVGSFFTFIGLITSFIATSFFINLIIFLIKKQGPGYGKLSIMLSSFPIWIPILSILGIGIGLMMLKKYDFSYKKNFLVIAILFIASSIISAFIIEKTGLNNIWARRGPIRKLYQQIEKGDKPLYQRRNYVPYRNNSKRMFYR